MKGVESVSLGFWECGSRNPMYNRKQIVSLLRATERSHGGEWLSLVEHLVRDQGVGGSNPLSPTILIKRLPDFSTVKLDANGCNWQSGGHNRHVKPPDALYELPSRTIATAI